MPIKLLLTKHMKLTNKLVSGPIFVFNSRNDQLYLNLFTLLSEQVKIDVYGLFIS